MEVKLNKEQHDFVENYRRILHTLADIQYQVDELQTEAKKYIKELNDLREQERALFPDQDVLDINEETKG